MSHGHPSVPDLFAHEMLIADLPHARCWETWDRIKQRSLLITLFNFLFSQFCFLRRTACVGSRSFQLICAQCASAHALTHTHTHTLVYNSTYTCIPACTNTFTLHLYTHMCTCVHTHDTYTYLYTTTHKHVSLYARTHTH